MRDSRRQREPEQNGNIGSHPVVIMVPGVGLVLNKSLSWNGANGYCGVMVCRDLSWRKAARCGSGDSCIHDNASTLAERQLDSFRTTVRGKSAFATQSICLCCRVREAQRI